MKTTLFLMLLFFGMQAANAQFLKNLGERAVNAAQRTVENRTEKESSQTTDKAIDKVLNGKNSSSSKNSKNNKSNNADAFLNTDVSINKNSDFVPGGSVIFSDDFSKDATGDFPAKWNSNGSGEVVEIGGTKWLAVNHNTVSNPELTKALPENSTIQFDLLLRDDGNAIPIIKFGIANVKNILKQDVFYSDNFFVNLSRYNERNGQTVEYGLKNNVLGNKDFSLTSYVNKVLHIDMAINGTRIRVYLDGEKIVDLPKALTPEMRNMFFIGNAPIVPASQTPLYLANLRIASGSADARSSVAKDLFEKGAASTSDILFDTGKSTIKPSSYTILDDLGNALKQNANTQVIIIGHTDADGDENANQKLSEQRAASVKDYLVSKFGISSSKIMTTGKGESEPVAENKTENGKKQNRRVEFKKL
ncbi:MAG: OmpA family protein [Edaphocola sp.]